MYRILFFIFPVVLMVSCETPDSKPNQYPEPIKMTAFTPSSQIEIFETAQGTDRKLQKIEAALFVPREQALEYEKSIFINPNKRFQKMIGIGGAITDASAEVFAALPEEK
jgi:glucosylceramidase